MSDIEERVKQYIDSRLTSKDSGYLGYYDSTAKRMKRQPPRMVKPSLVSLFQAIHSLHVIRLGLSTSTSSII